MPASKPQQPWSERERFSRLLGPLPRHGVLEPLHGGRAVNYRPPAWETHGRRGEVPSGAHLVIVEGVGVGRAILHRWFDALLWIQSDAATATERSLASMTGTDASDRRERWMSDEDPYLAVERPWEHADAVIAGAPGLVPHSSIEVAVSTAAPSRGSSSGSTPP